MPEVSEGRFSLAGQTALITGSSRGLGRAMALAAAQAGAHVVLNGLNPERLEAAVDDLRAAGLAASACAFDVGRPDEAGAAVKELVERHGGIDILVNNAGQSLRKPFLDYELADVEAVVQVHLVGGFMLTQAVARHMVARGRGCIVMVGSIAAGRGRGGHAPYAASKGAVQSLASALAVELGPLGVRCNTIAPGFFETDLNEELTRDSALYASVASRVPQRRWGQPADVGGALVFIASEAGAYLNGATITVDGGVTASL